MGAGLRAFFDTSVLIAAFVTKGACFRLVRQAAASRLVTGVTSETVLDEYARVLRTRFGIPDAQVRLNVGEIHRDFQIVKTPTLVPSACRDPSDDSILAAAVEAKVDVLVTGDKDLLVLGTHEGVEIISPANLLKRIEPAGPR